MERNVDLAQVEQTVRRKAYTIIEAKGETSYGIAARTAFICRCIVHDTRNILPLSHFLPEHEICLSLPCVLTSKGIERTVMPTMNEAETQAFLGSANAMKAVVAKAEEIENAQ
jgi:L-lactate dehydrogenase